MPISCRVGHSATPAILVERQRGRHLAWDWSTLRPGRTRRRRWNYKRAGCHAGEGAAAQKALITAGGFGDGTGSQQLSINSAASKGVPGTFLKRMPNSAAAAAS